jgi:hypothetical protein
VKRYYGGSIVATEVVRDGEKGMKNITLGPQWGEASDPARAGWAVLKLVRSGPVGWAGHVGHGSPSRSKHRGYKNKAFANQISTESNIMILYAVMVFFVR